MRPSSEGGGSPVSERLDVHDAGHYATTDW